MQIQAVRKYTSTVDLEGEIDKLLWIALMTSTDNGLCLLELIICGEDYEKPMRTGHKQVKCSSAAFLKMFICKLRSAQPPPQKRKMQDSCFS
jgi:hypothetical protein